jgi:hypothetical protein
MRLDPQQGGAVRRVEGGDPLGRAQDVGEVGMLRVEFCRGRRHGSRVNLFFSTFSYRSSVRVYSLSGGRAGNFNEKKG